MPSATVHDVVVLQLPKVLAPLQPMPQIVALDDTLLTTLIQISGIEIDLT